MTKWTALAQQALGGHGDPQLGVRPPGVKGGHQPGAPAAENQDIDLELVVHGTHLKGSKRLSLRPITFRFRR